MRTQATTLACIVLTLAGTGAGHAQNPVLTFEPGTRLRVSGCVPECGTRIKGEFVSANADSLTLMLRDHTTTVSLTNVHRIQMATPYRFNGDNALKVGGVAALLGLLLVTTDDQSNAAGEAIGMAAYLGVTGAALGGGGKKAARAGGIGALIGAPIIGIIAMASYEPCSGSFCFFDDQGAWFMMGAAAGAMLGFTVGGVIGALTGGDTWKDVGWDGVSVIAAPTPRGVSLGASLEF